MAVNYRDYLARNFPVRQQAAPPVPSPGLGTGMDPAVLQQIILARQAQYNAQRRLTQPAPVQPPAVSMGPSTGLAAPIPQTRWGDTAASVIPESIVRQVMAPVADTTGARESQLYSNPGGTFGTTQPEQPEQPPDPKAAAREEVDRAYSMMLAAPDDPNARAAYETALANYEAIAGPGPLSGVNDTLGGIVGGIGQTAGLVQQFARDPGETAKFIDQTIAPLGVEGIAESDAAKRASDVMPDSLKAVARKIDDTYQIPYRWAQEQTGQDIYKQAMSGGTGTTLNPYYYLDGSIEEWALDPENKTKIQTIYEKGLDLNGDGVIDVRGGDAVMVVFNSEMHPGFFDTLMTSMGMDPLFAASILAPAATAGRAGAQTSAEIAAIANMPKAERVALAVDRALSGITKVGELGNTVADLPFTVPIEIAKRVGQAVSAVPKVGAKAGAAASKIGWVFEPSETSAGRTAANEARDIAETVTNATDMPDGRGASPVIPSAPMRLGPGQGPTSAMGPFPATTPDYGPIPQPSVPYGTPQLPERSTYPDFEVGPGGEARVRVPRAAVEDTFAGMPRTNPEDLTPTPGDVNVTRARRWITEQNGKKTKATVTTVGDEGVVRVVNRGDGQFEVQVKRKNRWTQGRSFDDEGTAIDYGKTVVRSGDDVADQAADELAKRPKQQPLQEDIPTSAAADDATVAPIEESPPIVITKRWSLNTEKHPNGLIATAEREFPEQYQVSRQELEAVAADYEPRMDKKITQDPLQLSNDEINLSVRNPNLYADAALARAEFYTQVRETFARNGIPVERLPNEPKIKAGRNPVEKLVGDALYAETAGEAQAARQALYNANYAQSAPPRATLYDEIVNASLPTTSLYPNGSITVDGVPYTNVGIRGMGQVTRDGLARRAIAEQSIKYARGQKLKSAWRGLTKTGIGQRSPEALGIIPPAPSLPDGIPTIPDAYHAVSSKLWDKVIGKPEPPMRPSNPNAPSEVVAGKPFDDAYRSYQKDQINRFKQLGNLDDAEVGYLRTIVNVSEDGSELTAWDVLAEIIDRRVKDIPTGDESFFKPSSRAALQWRKGVADEFAAKLSDLRTGEKPIPVKKGVAEKMARSVTKKLGTLNRIGRENLLYNVVTGPRGWAQDAISTSIKLMWEGHTGAAIQGLLPNQVWKVAHGEADALQLMADRYGMDVPDQLRISGKFESGPEIDRTATNEAISNTLGIKEGSAGDRVVSLLTAPFSSRFLREGRAAHENTFRRAVMLDTIEAKSGEVARAFRANARKWGAQRGILPTSMDAYLYELGDKFSPDDVGRVIRELGHDAGLAGSATNELADMMAQQWRKQVNTLRNDAFDETKRVLYSYEKTNLDDFLGKFVFFHYWMSRSLPSYTRLALHNPELAALWFRAWDETADRAEEAGYPKSMVGMLRFMGDGESGWSRYYNPLQFFIPFDVLVQDPYADTTYEQLTQFAMISPTIQAMAAVMGLSDRAADPLGTYAIRGGITSILNEMRANGWIGEVKLQNDWYERAITRATEWANGIAAQVLPFVDDQHFRTQNDFNAEVMDYVMRETVAEAVGVPFDGNDPRWQPGGTYFEMWAEAKRDFAAGVENPIATEAYQEWARESLVTRGLNSAIPGGVRARFQPRDLALEAANSGDEGERMFREFARSGSDEDFTLNSLQDQYYAIGTPRQKAIADGWNAVVYGSDDIDPSYGLMLNGEFISYSDLQKMTEQERIEIADAWTAEHGGTEELESYRAERRAFLDQHPELGSYQEYKDAARDYEGGIRAFRENRRQGNPNYKRAEDEARKRLLDNGTDPSVIEDELDAWAISLPAYEAAHGIKGHSFDEDPISTGDQSTVDFMIGMGGGKSGGSSSKSTSTAMTESQKVERDLAEYDKEMAVVRGILAQYGFDAEALDSNNPLVRRAIENVVGDLLPSPSQRLELYWAWQDAVLKIDPNADVSLAAYQRALDQLEKEEAA